MLANALDVQTLRTLVTVLVGAVAAAAFPALKDLLLDFVRAKQRRAEAIAAQEEARQKSGRGLAEQCLDVLVNVKARENNDLAKFTLQVDNYELAEQERALLDRASALLPNEGLRIMLEEGLYALDYAWLVGKWGDLEITQMRYRFLTLTALRSVLAAYIRGEERPSDAVVLLARYSAIARDAERQEAASHER